MKLCNKCKIEKDKSEFSKDRTKKDGLHTLCKLCKSQATKNWTDNNSEYVKKMHKDYYLNNRDIIRKRVKDYSKRWYLKNRDKVLLQTKEYLANKKMNDINFKLAVNMRIRLNCAIKNNQKTGSAVKDLGCTIPELKVWLEQQFQPGMMWENYGEWHIDHIVPLSKFDLTDRKQLIKACHWFNLQPLWAEDNLQKSNKL